MKGQRSERAIAPTAAPAIALALAPDHAVSSAMTGVSDPLVSAAWDAHGVTGDGGATPSFERVARPGCARRARSAGSLPHRPCVLSVNAKRPGSDQCWCLIGVDSWLEAKRLSNSVQQTITPPVVRLKSVPSTLSAARGDTGHRILVGARTRAITRSSVGLSSDRSRRVAALRPLRGYDLDRSCGQPVTGQLRDG